MKYKISTENCHFYSCEKFAVCCMGGFRNVKHSSLCTDLVNMLSNTMNAIPSKLKSTVIFGSISSVFYNFLSTHKSSNS